MIRKLISIIFYVLGGFFIYMTCFMAFVSTPPEARIFKFVILGALSILILISLIIGAVIYSFQSWKFSIGITLLSGVGFNLFLVMFLFAFILDPNSEKFFPNNKLSSFNDYISGFSTMLIFGGLGTFILLKNNREENNEVHEIKKHKS